MEKSRIKEYITKMNDTDMYSIYDWMTAYIKEKRRLQLIDEFKFLWGEFAVRLAKSHDDVNIISGRNFKSTRYRALIALHAYEEWCIGITFRELSEICGCHWTALCKGANTMKERINNPRLGYTDHIDMDNEILTIYNHIAKA